MRIDPARTTVLCPIVHRIDDPEHLRDLGVESVCYAPVKIRALAQALKPSGAKASAGQTAQASAPVPPGLRVLIAEDDEDNRFLLQTYLGAVDIEVSFASDGRTALERYKNLRGDVDLLITDIQMPQMDGFELIKEVRKFETNHYCGVTVYAQIESLEFLRKNLLGDLPELLLLAILARSRHQRKASLSCASKRCRRRAVRRAINLV